MQISPVTKPTTRSDDFFRIQIGKEWTIARWNPQKETFRVNNYDYREEDIAQIEPDPVDPTPQASFKHLAISYQQWYQVNYASFIRSFRELYDGPWELFDEALFDYWIQNRE